MDELMKYISPAYSALLKTRATAEIMWQDKREKDVLDSGLEPSFQNLLTWNQAYMNISIQTKHP